MSLICAVPDCFDYPDDKRENPEHNVPVKEDQAGYRNNEEKGLNEEAGVIHDIPLVLLNIFL